MEEDFLARLAAIAAVKAAKARVSWYELPRDGWAVAVLLTAIAPGEMWTHEGVVGLVNPRVQIDVYAEKESAATTLARAIKEELQRTDAVTQGETVFLPPAELNMKMFDTDQIGGTDSAPGRKVYRAMQDFTFFAQPAA